MNLWREGDRSVGLCARCGKKVGTRFERRTYPLKRPRVDVADVLVSVCEECDGITDVPYQSLPKVAEARARETKKVEVRVTMELEEVLGLVAARFAARVEALSNPLLRYYLHEVWKDVEMASMAMRLARDPLAHGPNRSRISLSLEKPLWDGAWEGAKRAGMKGRSEIIRGVILAAAIDAGIDKPRPDEKPSPRRRVALEAIAASVG